MGNNITCQSYIRDQLKSPDSELAVTDIMTSAAIPKFFLCIYLFIFYNSFNTSIHFITKTTIVSKEMSPDK